MKRLVVSYTGEDTDIPLAFLSIGLKTADVLQQNSFRPYSIGAGEAVFDSNRHQSIRLEYNARNGNGIELSIYSNNKHDEAWIAAILESFYTLHGSSVRVEQAHENDP